MVVNRETRARADSRGVGSWLRGSAQPAVAVMIVWLALLWLLEAVDTAGGHTLDSYGITPRRFSELSDVVPAAFMHASFGHLMANSLPLLVLGFLVALRGVGRFLLISLTVIVISGLGVWLVSPAGTTTLGASGLIFGLLSFLLLRGFVDKKLLDIGIGIVVFVLYGSVLWGVMPQDNGISWQAHLFGLIGGVIAAIAFRANPKRPVSAR